MCDNNNKTFFLHTAYATSADGSSGFSTTDSVGKTYIGKYIDSVAEDSNVASSYTWVLFEGDKGDTGVDGKLGKEQNPQVEQEQQSPKKLAIPTWAQYTIIIAVVGFLHLSFLNSLAIGFILGAVFELINRNY